MRLSLRCPLLHLLVVAPLFANACSQRSAAPAVSNSAQSTVEPAPEIGEKPSVPQPFTPVPPLRQYRAQWAIIVGIDKYPGLATELEPLQFAVNDAREVRDLLRDEFGYQQQRVLFLTDKDATRAALQAAFDTWLPAQGIHASDAVLVYFAGHGLIDRNDRQGYLAAVDSRRNDLANSCLSVAWIRERLAELPCLHKLVVLDSCYSGSLFQDKRKEVKHDSIATKPELPDPNLLDPKRNPRADYLTYHLSQPAFWGMSAGRYTPVADGLGDKRHSVFTSTFLQVLRERADTPRADHIFTFREAAAQIESRVAGALGSRQIPEWGRLAQGDGDFLFHPTITRMTPRELSEQRKQLANWQDYSRDLAFSQQAWEKSDYQRAVELLDRHIPVPGTTDLRGFEWYYLWREYHRDRRTLRGHTGTITCMAYSPDGQVLATGSSSHTVKLWNPETGQAKVTVARTQSISSVAFAPGGELIAAVGDDNILSRWEVATGKELPSLEGDARFYSIAFTPNGKSMVVVCAGDSLAKRPYSVWVWDTLSGKVRAKYPFSTYELFVGSASAISPDGKTLAVGAWNPREPSFLKDGKWQGGGQIVLMDLETGRTRSWHTTQKLEHEGLLSCLAFSPDGKTLASGGLLTYGSSHANLKIWDVATGEIQGTYLKDYFKELIGRSHDMISSVTYSQDGKKLAVGCARGALLVDAATGQILSIFKGHTSGVSTVAFSRDGTTLATGSGDHTAKIWNLSGGKYDLPIQLVSGEITALKFSPQGETIATVSGETITLLDPTSGKQRSLAIGNKAKLRCLVFTPDGKTLRTLTEPIKEGHGSEVISWDVTTATPSATMPLHSGASTTGVFADDGSMLAIGYEDKTVRVWDVITGSELCAFDGRGGAITALKFSSAGKLLAVASADKSVRVWSISTRKLVAVIDNMASDIRYLTFSPDSQLFAAASSDGVVKLWNVAAAQEQSLIRVSSGALTALEFHPSGRTLAVASEDKSVLLWNVNSGQVLIHLKGHAAAVRALAFDPHGKWLATGSVDGKVRRFQAATGEEIEVWKK